MGDSLHCLYWVVPEGMSQVSRRSEVVYINGAPSTPGYLLALLRELSQCPRPLQKLPNPSRYEKWTWHVFGTTSKGKAPKGAWGGRLSGERIYAAFLRLYEPQHNAMCCVALNPIDPSYVICIWSFVVLCPHYSILSSPLPFRRDKISRKGRVFQLFVMIGFYKKAVWGIVKSWEFEGTLRCK